MCVCEAAERRQNDVEKLLVNKKESLCDETLKLIQSAARYFSKDGFTDGPDQQTIWRAGPMPLLCVGRRRFCDYSS